MGFSLSGLVGEGAQQSLEEILTRQLLEAKAAEEQRARRAQEGMQAKRLTLDRERLAADIEDRDRARRDASNRFGVADMERQARLMADEEARRAEAEKQKRAEGLASEIPDVASRQAALAQLLGLNKASREDFMSPEDRQREAEAARRARVNDEVTIRRASRGPENEPLVAVVGEDGRSVLVPRSEAAGKQPAGSREQGRQVTSGDANDIAEFNSALDDLGSLRGELEGNDATGTSAKIGAMMWTPITNLTGWGVTAKQKQAQIDRVKQVIGKALEGGVLRSEDEIKYEKILPTIQDAPELVTAKLNGLVSAIKKKQERKLEALGSAGYDVSRFAQPSAGGESGKVKMRAPDGRDVMVPADKVEEAKARGAKVVG